MPSPEQEEFQTIRKEIADEDPIVRGIAAVDLGSFASDHPEYKDRSISILLKMLDDPDADVRTSAKKSLDMLEGKPMLEPRREVIAFGFLPEEYREKRPEIDRKQMIISCICCITLILVMIFLFSIWFWPS